MSSSETPIASSRPWGGVLVISFSNHGHTASVARRLAATLLEEGLVVDLRDATVGGDVDPDRHDVVIVGASLQREPDRREIVAWIVGHRQALADRPTALFSALLPTEAGSAEGRRAAHAAIADLVAETGWAPARSAAIVDPADLERFADEVAILAATPLVA